MIIILSSINTKDLNLVFTNISVSFLRLFYTLKKERERSISKNKFKSFILFTIRHVALNLSLKGVASRFIFPLLISSICPAGPSLLV